MKAEQSSCPANEREIEKIAAIQDPSFVRILFSTLSDPSARWSFLSQKEWEEKKRQFDVQDVRCKKKEEEGWGYGNGVQAFPKLIATRSKKKKAETASLAKKIQWYCFLPVLAYRSSRNSGNNEFTCDADSASGKAL